FICRSNGVMQNHRREKHQDQDGSWKCGRQSTISCQRFYPTQAGSRLFEISCSEPPTGSMTQATASLITPAAIIRARVEQALLEGQAVTEQAHGQVPTVDPHPTAVSPWLELTRWPEYLRGQDLTAIALLGCLPDATSEPLLEQFIASTQRLIDQAYCSIKEDRINEFDQIAINTFFRRPGIWNRPIQIYLRPATYRRYCQVWQRLVCFAYRSSRTDQPISLRHQLNTAQFAALDQMEVYSQQLVDLSTQRLDLDSSLRA
ncbi:hypothetical protein FE257_007498, partial [Aspergillus nanangensis]